MENPTIREYDIDDWDDKNAYDDMLDECFDACRIGGMEYTPSRVLEAVDPTAYRCGFNDWTDSLPVRWECPLCGTIHEDDEDAARYCCQEEDEAEQEEDEAEQEEDEAEQE